MNTARAHQSLRITVLGASVGVLVLTSALGAAAVPATETPTAVDRGGSSDTATYLALGTSLAIGYQPGRGKTSKGYVDDLWHSMQQQVPALGLRNKGCRGETSRSMITGQNSNCDYSAGSQLDDAVAYLEAHPDEVAFITVEVGANDLVNRCMHWRTGSLDRECAAEQSPRQQRRLTHIVEALVSAGPGVPIVAMTYYNPLLGVWDLVPRGRALAHHDQRVWSRMNAGLTGAYVAAGATVADVGATFRIDDFANKVRVPGHGRIPVNVALACEWTWFCSKKHAFDFHANGTGYQKIAHTFHRELRSLVP
jgi:lysophospholipase L1-like esterase